MHIWCIKRKELELERKNLIPWNNNNKKISCDDDEKKKICV
jgi:hypothetical protein